MDESTFLAALEKYPQVRQRDYRGYYCSPVKKNQEGKVSSERKKTAASMPTRNPQKADKITEQVLTRSPFFKLLFQKLTESGIDQSEARLKCEAVLKEYERYLSRINIEDIEETLERMNIER